MFHKFSKTQFQRTFSNLKNHAIHGYHHIKNIAHNIDYGVSVAKDVYRILEPVIKEYAGHNNNLHGHAMKAITGYETLRNQAMEAHSHVSNVGQKLSGLVQDF